MWRSFRQSPCAMAVYDLRLRLRRANADMEHALGRAEVELRGLPMSRVLPAPSGQETDDAMRRALESGTTQHLEYVLPAPDRRHHKAIWSVSLAPVRDDGGEVRGVVLAAHDITEQYEARQRLLLLNEASTRIGDTLDTVRTAQELTEVAVPRLADFVVVELLPSIDSGGEPPDGPPRTPVVLRRVACNSVYEGCPETAIPMGYLGTYPEGSAVSECLLTGRGVLSGVTDDVLAAWDAEVPEQAAKIRKFGFHSVMSVPLRARGTTMGVAVFVRHRNPEPFERDDLLLAEEMTARAGVCVDNARRYTRERDTTLALQRSLLPRKLPRNAAVEVASRYLPAGSRAGVGGDWFDVIPLSGARVALVVGDVVGHGLQASATMGRLRTAVRTLADVDLPPDELLTHLDDLVNRLAAEGDGDHAAGPAGGHGIIDDPDAAGDLGATCLVAVYDPVSRHCTAARAGHPLPAVVRPDGQADFLDMPVGPPLGLGSLPFESVEVELPEGSLIALYTNGLIEGRDNDVDEALDALRSALTRPAASLEETCDTVLSTLLPQRPSDDVALLVARTRALGASQVATWDLAADPAEVGKARRSAAAQLARWGLDDAVFTTELVVSELVTNAVRHAEPPIQLRLIHDRTLICEVSDGSGTAPHLRRARMFDEGGRGLLLVARLTQSWGTRQTPGGKTIWAEQVLG